jgi:O-antigen ligase
MAQEKQMPGIIRSVVILLILLTPAFTNLVEHAGSIIILLLAAIGIYTFFKTNGIEFSKPEKTILSVFAVYFFFDLFMTVGHNFFSGQSLFKLHLDHSARMLTIFPIYYLFIQANIKKEIIWYGIVAAAVASGVYALVNAIATDFSSRVVGPYNPCLFGYFCVALAFMSLSGYHFFYKKNKKLIILPLFGFMCGLLAAFLSGTRGSVITIPFLSVIFIFQIKRYLSSFNAKIVITAMAGTFILLLLLFPHTRLADRFETGINEARYFIKNHDCVECIGKGEAHHLRMWIEALIIIKDHPIAGVGPNGYRKIVTDRINDHKIAPGIEKFKTPHNMYLTMLTSYGIFGLIVLMAFFLTPLSALIFTLKNSNGKSDMADLSYCGIYLIFGYMLFSMTGTLFIRNMLITFYIIMLAAILSVNRPLDPRPVK